MNLLVEEYVNKSVISWFQISDSKKTFDQIYASWCNSNFLFKEEDLNINVQGLRPPQIGGVFAALGYERSDEDGAATIVMPTGTGKTETILSIVVAGKFKRSLVIVPSDPLREQMKNKFIQLGLLRELSLIDNSVENPIVSTIKHGANDIELDKLLESNVIISTAAALSKFSYINISKLAQECSHLIVDEAHHITASTWARVKKLFTEKKVFQFTATPFRNDGSKVEGKIIFNYPLKKAQEDGYFKPIEFHPVREFFDQHVDEAIAQKATDLLRADLDAGFDHILMARAYPIKRAEEIFKFYNKNLDLKPVLINSKIKKKADVMQAIKNGEHKIIVCVDMLGEGFDLPQLKISAIHDPHKSMNIMLQFTGRFTRNTQNVGNAKFVANIVNPKVNKSLEELYNENSDWNSIISNISSNKVDIEKKYQAFRSKFTDRSKLLDLGLTPSISTTIYKMDLAKWTPLSYRNFESKNFQIMDYTINDESDTLIFSVKSYLPVGWTSSKELFNESWDLYIAYYNKKLNLLFIHSSAKDGLVKRLVNLLAENAKLVKGDYVFRALAGLKRLKLQNVGLNKNKKGLRYSMHTGTEINEQIPEIETNRAIKSNIFGKGYENGKLVSIGCSHKGKVWAMESDSLDKWISWCKGVGKKIIDDSIDTNHVMKTAMQTEELEKFPNIQVLMVEWPLDLLRKNNLTITISSNTWEENLIRCELVLSESQLKDNKSINFYLRTSSRRSLVTASVTRKGEISFTSHENLKIRIGEHKFVVSEYFNENPPTFFLADTSVIDGGLRYYPYEEYSYLYEKNNIKVWDWSNIDISTESQTENKIRNSIQYHTIQQIQNSYDIIFDDDGAGEIADIVAIKNLNNEEITIDLFHCKYCSKKNGIAKPGARVKDVYEVAGQAVKSVKWFGNKEKLILRLMDRESKRLNDKKNSRIDKGRYEDLVHISKVARYATFRLGMTIVQPAISKEVISKEQLSLLGATEAYIEEVSGIKIKVVTSG